MRYGFFDTAQREYVIDRVDVPVSWTNYLGTEEMATAISHHGGGYTWFKSPEYHRVTRFRPNGVPMDRPGYYVYLRDADDGDYWSVSWQPVGKPLDQASYACRHGLSYTTYACTYKDITATQTMFIPRGDDVQLWDVKITNDGDTVRTLDVFGYLEFSFHHIMIDNQNFQMSLYCSGSRYRNGACEYELHYENAYQFFTANFEPDGYDCVRDTFLGAYHTESNPAAVEKGQCTGSAALCYNSCGALQKHLTLQPGEEARLLFILGQGDADAAAKARARYATPEAVDKARQALADFWQSRLGTLQVNTPNPGMNESLNLWNLYQSEINVLFSRFASFIEVGGRTGLGYRDTAQDAMCIVNAEPEGCKWRIGQLLQGLTSMGYGLHLFEPRWFEDEDPKKETFKSPTVIPTPDRNSIVHGLEDACADDALWLVSAITNYVYETGDFDFLWQEYKYADGGQGTVYEHMTRILEFSNEQVGAHGVCKGLRADWNDCLNLGGGESAMVSELHLWALNNFVGLARAAGQEADAKHYEAMAEHVRKVCQDVLWDGKWFIRGITKNGEKIGTQRSEEGKVHMESNTWAVISGAATREQALSAMDSVDEYLYTDYGLMLNAPSFTKPDDDLGFIGRVYPGVKENGSVFSHPNPWAWVAESMLGRGSRAMKFYDALLPYNQNDKIEVRFSEPYSYCQFIMGKDNGAFGRANHPWMTGSAGWAYFAATQYMLGVRPGYDTLTIDPCIPAEWDGFTMTRIWRGATYHITVSNPGHVEKGVKSIAVDGKAVDAVPAMERGTTHEVHVVMG